jgi:hypothetical protein
LNDTSQPLIVPIGHFVGEVYDVGTESTTYNLRGGWSIVKLTEAERNVWAFAHGLPDQLQAGTRWTRQTLLDTIRLHAPEPDPEPIIDDLLSRDVLAEVTPGTKQAIEFASTYRLIPLQTGLGNSREEPWVWRIGIGAQTLVAVSGTVYNAWEWSHLYQSLWDSCRNLARIREGDAGSSATAEERDPEAIFTEVLNGLHALVSTSCAYLDVPHEWGTP